MRGGAIIGALRRRGRRVVGSSNEAAIVYANHGKVPPEVCPAANARTAQTAMIKRTNATWCGSLADTVDSRTTRGLERVLRVRGETEIDFSSNDYLGFAACVGGALNGAAVSHGSTGSRLLTGNSSIADALERRLCGFYGVEDALLFNSGYDLNLGLMACLPSPGDVVLFDSLCHNSLREGMRLTRGGVLKLEFRHNDVEHVRELLSRYKTPENKILIVVESVYSMDGHTAPLVELQAICTSYANSVELVVDEAHGSGVFGRQGRGVCDALGVVPFIRVVTFGKALGTHGAVCLCPTIVRRYLLNYHRPLIFSTAMSPASLVAVGAAYDMLELDDDARANKLRELVHQYKSRLSAALPSLQAIAPGLEACESNSCVQGIIIPGNVAVVFVAAHLRDEFNVNAMPIRSPTVAGGSERVRIVLHSFNTVSEIDILMTGLASALKALQAKL